jgi:hypothetical protein
MTRTRGLAPLLVLIVGAELGCAGRSRGRESESPSPPSVAPLSLAMLGTSAGGLTDGEAFDRLFEAPEVAAAGERLLGRLGQDPTLTPLYEGFTTRLFEQPAMLASLARLAMATPGISADELTATAVARLSFDTALDRALDRLLDRPAVDAAFGRMADALVERAHITDRLAALMLHWRPELEATLGVPMTDERFGPRLAEHLGNLARTSAMQQLFADRMVDDPGVRESLAALLDDEAFLGACASVIRTLLESPDFQERAAAVIAGMLEEIDTEEMTVRVERVLVTPELEAALVKWSEETTASATFGTLGERLGAVLDDPNLQAELLAIIAGTSVGRTA